MKFSSAFEDPSAPYRHGNTWARTLTSDGNPRLEIAPSEGHVRLLLALSQCFSGPYFAILYELEVPRNRGEPGRYQSPWVLRDDVRRFFSEFANLFEGDGRANVWLAALPEDGPLEGQIVYDRHELIYAYGPLERFAETLTANGLRESEPVVLRFPHQHHYNAEFDDIVEALLNYWDWSFFPLQELPSAGSEVPE